MLNIRYSTVKPDEVARRLAHLILTENTRRVQDLLNKDEKEGLVTMQMILDIMLAWTNLISEIEPE